jgi:hypothetical protein
MAVGFSGTLRIQESDGARFKIGNLVLHRGQGRNGWRLYAAADSKNKANRWGSWYRPPWDSAYSHGD